MPGLITFISITIILSSAVLAIVGLREYSRSRGAYRQGKAQAIWTLALSGLVAAYPILSLAQARWNIFHKEKTPITARVMVFDNLNFKFFAPGDPWYELEGDPLDFKPAMLLRCKGSEVHFAVVAQPAGPKRKYSSDQFETLATNTFSKALEDVKILSRAPIWRENLEGLQLDIEAGHRGQTLYLEDRLFKLNDWTYQLITWAPKRHENIVMDYAPRLLLRFELLDYTPKGNPFDDLPNVWIKP